MDSLVSTAWLAEQLAAAAADLVVLDCTVWLRRPDDGGVSIESGRPSWEAGHIPGAGFADLTGDLCDPTSRWSFALPSPEHFAAAMAALGVGNDSRVVLYDDNATMWAARVWWMLRWIGFDAAAVLDGGMTTWRAEGRPISTETPERAPATLTPRPRPELIATKADVLAAIDDRATCIVDALGGDQYRGTTSHYRRPGHIPGASNAPARDLLDPGTHQHRRLEDVADRFPSDRAARTITYCGGGIAASLDAFVLTRLGFTDVAVYTASLQEWTADPDAPLMTSD